MIKNKTIRDYIFNLIVADSVRINKPLKREIGEHIRKQLDKLSGTKELQTIESLLKINYKR